MFYVYGNFVRMYVYYVSVWLELESVVSGAMYAKESNPGPLQRQVF